MKPLDPAGEPTSGPTHQLSAERLRRIGHYLRTARAREGGDVIQPAERTPLMPQSFAQQRVWFVEQAFKGTAMYNMPECARLRGDLDLDCLRLAIEEIVRRHEIWRTTFGLANGMPVQRIVDWLAPEFTFETSVGPDPEAGIRVRLADLADRPFDLTNGPLVRVHVLKAAERDHFLMLDVHHMVSDGWSTGVFLAEFAELYAAARTKRAARLAQLPIQYADFAVWQRGYWNEDRIEHLLGIWERALGSSLSSQLPIDRPRPAQPDDTGNFRLFEIPADVTARLKALASTSRTTLFAVLASAFSAVLNRLTGQDDIRLGVPIAGRSRVEFEPMLGLFANTAVLRAEVDRNAPFVDLLSQVTRASLSAYAHQDLPFERLVQRLQPERDVTHNPLFQIMFILQNMRMPVVHLPDLTMELIAAGTRSVKFDIVFELYEISDGLRGWLGYQTALFDDSTVSRLLARYGEFLADLVASPDRPIAQIGTGVDPALAALRDGFADEL